MPLDAEMTEALSEMRLLVRQIQNAGLLPGGRKRKGGKRPRKPLPWIPENPEVDAMLAGLPDNARGLRIRCIIETMYRAGLRVSEVCDLVPADIRWQDQYIEVRDGKGGKDRCVPMDSRLRSWLDKWEGARPKAAGAYFARSSSGKPTGVRDVQRYVAAMGKGAGVAGKLTPHTFRHLCATNWLEEGLTLAEVQQLLGHSHASTTGIYLHVRNKGLAEKVHNLGLVTETGKGNE